ncbi:hypothetical protein L208DRAFT_1383159, partial [Tricholoma matsutake]
MGIIGAMFTKLRWETFLFSIFYYYVTGLGMTTGYHRLWAHRSYNASNPLQCFLTLAGAGAVEGSIKWWSRGSVLEPHRLDVGETLPKAWHCRRWGDAEGGYFPMDYRNAIKWYQWFILVCQQVGLASHLKVFPDNEVRKGQLAMQLKKLRETQETLEWPSNSDDLP